MTEAKPQLLLIDDDAEDAFIIRDLINEIQDTKYEIIHVQSYEAGLAALRSGGFDACLLDFRLGARSGLELLTESKNLGIGCPIILLTGYGDVDVDIEAMKRGAADYLVKDRLTSESLARSLRFAIKREGDLARLQEQTDNFKTLFNSTFEGIIVHQDDLIIDANVACGEIFGCPPEAMVGTRISGYFRMDDPEIFQKSLSCSAGVGIEVIGQKGDTEVSLEIFSRRASLRGRVVQITTVQDLSRRKQLEAQVLQQDRLASLGLLASSLAHEIGTPLGVIRGRAEMLERVVPDDAKKNVGIMIAQIDRITKLMFSVLQLARGKQADTIAPVNVGMVLDDIVSLLAHEFERKQIALEIHLPSDSIVRAEPGPLG
ncbi:MAG TPA: response regulator, partial [Bdellovibrionales bacterium]|nr:response regulator [Bdellovibrionales bacterium]